MRDEKPVSEFENNTLEESAVQPAVTDEKTEKRWRRRTRLAFWAAIIAPIIVFVILAMTYCLPWVDHPIVLYVYWLPLGFAVLSIAVIIWGLYLKAKGRDWETTVRLGIVSTICIGYFFYMGMLRYQDLQSYYHNQEAAIRGEVFAQKVEPLLDIDVPDCEAVHVSDCIDASWTGRNRNCERYKFWLDHDAASLFEARLAIDERWQQNVRNELLGIQPGLLENDWEEGEFALFYNMDLQEFNQVPPEDGTYRYLYVSYDPQWECLLIVEYDLVYVK